MLTLVLPPRHSIQLKQTTRHRHYEPFQNNKTVYTVNKRTWKSSTNFLCATEFFTKTDCDIETTALIHQRFITIEYDRLRMFASYNQWQHKNQRVWPDINTVTPWEFAASRFPPHLRGQLAPVLTDGQTLMPLLITRCGWLASMSIDDLCKFWGSWFPFKGTQITLLNFGRIVNDASIKELGN